MQDSGSSSSATPLPFDQSDDVTSDGTTSRRALESHPSDEVIAHIVAIKCKRMTTLEAFLEALEQSPALSACREQLLLAGHDVPWPNGTLIFVQPEYFQPVVERLKREPARFDNGDIVYYREFKRWHIIVSAELEFELRSILNSFRSQDQVIPKARAAPFCVLTDRRPPELDYDKTFIRVRTPSSLWSGASSGPKVASTPGAGAANPRKRRDELQQSPQVKKKNSSQSLGGFSPGPGQTPPKPS